MRGVCSARGGEAGRRARRPGMRNCREPWGEAAGRWVRSSLEVCAPAPPLHFTHNTSQGAQAPFAAQKTLLFVQAAPKSELGQALIESPETSSPSNQFS